MRISDFIVRFTLAAGVAKAEQTAEEQQDLPTVKLPYGTWRATSYDQKNDVS